MTEHSEIVIPEGKVVIVDFWATWCGPCRESFPKLQELYAKYKASGLEIIAISVDDDSERLTAFAKANGDVKFILGWDKDHTIAAAYRLEALPTTYVLDRSGRIAHTHRGYTAAIEREIRSLF